MCSKMSQLFSRWFFRVRLSGYLSLGLLIMAGLLTACAASASAPTPTSNSIDQSKADYAGKKILWVNSYHQGYEWSDGIGAGLEETLNNTGVQFKTIWLDAKRNPSDEFIKQAALQAKTEIEAFKPDVLIASDDIAQKYLIVPYYRDTDMPVIFAGVNWDASIYGYPTRNVTGMVEVELPAQLVEHLKKYARGERLGYITVDSETERKVAKVYNERFFDGKMKEYWVKTYAEFKETLLKAQNEVDILFIGNNAGSDQWPEPEVEQFILKNTTLPTGTINSWMAPYALITLAKKPEEQGQWAAQTALRILDGSPVSEIPVTENKKGKLILNLDIAEKLGVVFSPSLLRNAEIYGAK